MALCSLPTARWPRPAKPGLGARSPFGPTAPRAAKPGLAPRQAARWLGTLLLALVAAGCDSGATGIDGCRSIEQARCRAVVGCPGSPIETAEQVSNCELFYADHCLHGMADQLDPDQGSVEACVNAIALARACADAGQTLGTCVAVAADAGTAAPSMITGTSPDTTGCQAVQNPEILQACNFLAAAPTPAGTAGAGGAGGSSAQGGTGG